MSPRHPPLRALARPVDLVTPWIIRRDATAVRTIRKAAADALVDPIERDAGGAADGYLFTISTESRDLMGDIVVQAGREDVAERIPAQLDHSGAMRDLIGHWTSIQTRGAKTTARLKLFDRGLSPAADMVRALLDAGLRMAASIGFLSVKREWIREPDTDQGAITGIRFLRWKLLEASVVVVPANPEALSAAKRFLPAPARAELDEFVRAHARRPLPPSRAAAAAGIPRGALTVTIAERIAEARRQLAETRTALAAARERLADDPEDEELGLEVERLADSITGVERTLRRLGDAEAAQAATATPAGAVRATGARAVVVATAGDDIVDVEGRPVRRQAAAIIHRRGEGRASADLVVRAAIVAFVAHKRNLSLDEAISVMYPDDEEVRAVSGTFIRAAQNPAMTSVAGWAQELTRNSFGAYMDLLKAASVVPRLPLFRQDFAGFARLTFPRRRRPAGAPNLAAAFRREGDPIRVGAITLGSTDLTPKSMGVISTFTNELLERSTPDIEAIVRDAMISDTAEVLDGIFLDNNPEVAGLRPPGLQFGVAAPNTAASTGTTPDKVLADLKARAVQMTTSRFGKQAAWIMNTSHWISVKLMQNAMGSLAFPEATTNGTLCGYPVVDSIDVPPSVVFLIDGSVIPFAGGSPVFNGTDVATIHEEDTAPLPIATAGTPNVVAAPARSLWQTNSQGVRAVWEIDWDVATDVNAGAVQTITAVAW